MFKANQGEAATWTVIRKDVQRRGWEGEVIATFDNEGAARNKVYHLTVAQGGGGHYYEVKNV